MLVLINNPNPPILLVRAKIQMLWGKRSARRIGSEWDRGPLPAVDLRIVQSYPLGYIGLGHWTLRGCDVRSTGRCAGEVACHPSSVGRAHPW